MNEPGAGVDASGNPVLDPTKNVLDLVEAAVIRLNDLREADKEHRKEMDELRTSFAREIREAETARIDAIRAVDVGAVQRAAEVQADVATALANQVALSAETLRNTVSETATLSAAALAQAIDPLQKAIDDLRRAQYEQQGQKQQVVERQAAGSGVGLWAGIALSGFVALVSLLSLVAYVATH
jgi:hypothetical protein